MTISTYSDLQDEITDWMARNDLSAKATTCIQLAEARLNRVLKPVETSSTLTATPASHFISITALSMVEPIGLFLTTDGNEAEIPPLRAGRFPYSNTSGRPDNYAVEGDVIVFNRPADQAHTFRFRFKQRFALSDAATTNWLLENHPDAYLAASIVWGKAYVSDQSIVAWKAMLDEAIPEIRNYIARQNPAVLVVDDALATIGRGYREWELE